MSVVVRRYAGCSDSPVTMELVYAGESACGKQLYNVRCSCASYRIDWDVLAIPGHRLPYGPSASRRYDAVARELLAFAEADTDRDGGSTPLALAIQRSCEYEIGDVRRHR